MKKPSNTTCFFECVVSEFFMSFVLLIQSSVNYSTELGISTPSAKPCYQDFVKREAFCDRRNLEYVPAYLNEDIQQIDFTLNNIAILLNTSFSRYSLLQQLSLRWNDIHLIQGGAFYPLKHLRILDLSNNPKLQWLSV